MFVMQQAIWQNSSFLSDNETLMKKAGILDHYRKIFIFIDKQEYLINKNVASGKMFLINFSLSKTNNTGFSNNGEFLRFMINMYSFNIEFVAGFNKMDLSVCQLLEAFSNDAYYDLNRNIYTPQNQILYDNKNSINNQFLKEALIDMEYNSYDVIPEPIYYSSNQQFLKTGEPPEILNSIVYTLSYQFKQLKDQKTSISLLDISKFQSFRETKLMELKRAELSYAFPETDLPIIDIKQIISDLFYYNAETLLEGLVFSYDSCVGDVAIHKPNWAVTMSFSKQRPEKQQIEHIFEMKRRIKNAMNLVEKEHGNVLMFYCPFAHGDNFSIHFRDYNKDNQPIALSSEEVDKMYSLDTVIGDCMSSVSDFE